MKTTLSIIFASALAASAPAFAETAPALNVSVVRTADLDLASSAGQRSLDQRLVVAAHAVCDTAAAVDLKGRNDQRQCRDQVLSAARAKAGAIATGAEANRTILVAAQQ